jgi:carbamoyltransferase
VPWELATERDRRYADIAATLQAVTEDALLALAREARRRTGADALCLAGGVALNAVANARLAREAGFARVFVQPAAGDAGGALGAALLGALEQGDPRPPPMTSAALGLPIDPAVAAELAAELGLSVCRTDDPAAAAAELVARGKIAAWCQGRFEWGPRALGQRSILADPCDAESRERLNRAIKRREPFRPFAPAVLASRAAAYFDDLHAAADLTPFMTTVCRVRDPGVLAAVTHVDGTARVQTVADDAALAPVLRALPQPLVLNTSLNGPGEPIIASEQDALAFLLGHPIDALVLGDLVITKS